jgi:molybdenum cofactor cytidylyltransferase
MKPQPSDRSAVALGAIILAAGRSTRMGRPKLLLPWGQTSVLGHLLEQWDSLGARQVAVVVGLADRGLERELDRLGFSAKNRVVNENPELGMFNSIQCAAHWTGWAPGVTHWSIVLGDQPHLRPASLQALLALSANHSESVCQPARGGRRRHPVLLPRTVFVELSSSSAVDLKDFLAPYEIKTFESDDPGLDLDIDRPADYEKALALWANEPEG